MFRALGARAGAGVALGSAIAAVALVASLALADSSVEDGFDLYWLFHLRGPVQPPPEVVVVAIDSPSLQRSGLRSGTSGLSRRVHAEVLRRLAAAGAAVVAFDVQFEAEADDAGDAELASAIKDAGNVLLAEAIVRRTIAVSSTPGRAPGQVLIDTAVPPAPALAAVARGSAAFPLPKTSRVDTYWTFLSRSDSRPSLPVLALFEFALPGYDDLQMRWNTAVAGRPSTRLPGRDAMRRLGSAEAIALLRDAMLADPVAIATLQRDLEAQHARGERDLVRRSSALVATLAGNAARYVNYYGPARTVPTLSYDDVLAAAGRETALAQRIAGKVVFVGYSGASTNDQDRIRDDYPTVYASDSDVRLSGVEIAATAFANLLDRSDPRPLAPAAGIAVLVACGLVLGIVARLARPLLAVPVVAGLAGGYVIAASALFTARALVLPLLLPILVEAPVALLAGALLHYRAARREREAIKHTFGHFLPRHVVDDLAKGMGSLTASNKLVRGACLSTDMAQYSALAESIPPGELAALMDRYFARLFAPVKARGGIVLNVVGDAMLAIWTTPGLDVEVRRNACLAALDVARAAQGFDAQAPRGALVTRIAVHSGELMLGSFGAAEHFEYRAVGDIVNTATRIDGLNKYLGTRCLVSAPTLHGLDDFITRPLGEFVLAGKKQSLAVHELMGLARDASPAARALAETFADALVDYQARRWQAAAARFDDFLRAFPDDGPAAFYRDRCTALAAHAPADWQPAIAMDAK